jgi:hypothetical protein
MVDGCKFNSFNTKGARNGCITMDLFRRKRRGSVKGKRCISSWLHVSALFTVLIIRLATGTDVSDDVQLAHEANASMEHSVQALLKTSEKYGKSQKPLEAAEQRCVSLPCPYRTQRWLDNRCRPHHHSLLWCVGGTQVHAGA